MLYYLLTVSGVELCGNSAFLSTRFKGIGKEQSYVGRIFQGRFTTFSVILGLSTFGQFCWSCFGFPTNAQAIKRIQTFAYSWSLQRHLLLSTTHTPIHTLQSLWKLSQRGWKRSRRVHYSSPVFHPVKALGILNKVWFLRGWSFDKQSDLFC